MIGIRQLAQAPGSFRRLLAGRPRVATMVVTKGARQLLEDALKLGSQERADLAAKLIESLDPETDEDVDAAWAEEITRRAARAIRRGSWDALA